MRIYGYFDDPAQTVPVFDPGLNVGCPICGKSPILPDDVRTISLIVPKEFKHTSGRVDTSSAERSYFYRVHRSCHEPLDEKQRSALDGLLVDAICSTRNTN